MRRDRGVTFNTSGCATLPAYGTNASPLYGCFCGRPGAGDACFPPRTVFLVPPELCPSFAVDSLSATELLQAWWGPAWPCPAQQLSNQSGALSASEMNDWLQGVQRNYSIFGQDLLRSWRSCFRVGNYPNLTGLAPPTYRAVQPAEAVLPLCAPAYAGSSPLLLDPEAALRSFVTRLFPVAQGVFEAGKAFCLRYTVEAALLTAIKLAMASHDLAAAYAVQRQTADLWRAKCEGQIVLLALCKGLDAFQPPFFAAHRTFPCPFTINVDLTTDVYMTPCCLVHSGGLFYDPCSCGPCDGGLFTACQIPFDPRGAVTESISLGGWRVSPLEVFLQADFTEAMLSSDATSRGAARGQ